MKYSILTTIFLTTFLLNACGPTKEGEAQHGNKKLLVKVPSTRLKIKQGGQAEFSVTVVRENFDGDVELEMETPAGLSITEKKRTVSKGVNSATFHVQADKTITPNKTVRIKVRGKSGPMMTKPDAEINVAIEESLETLRQKKMAFVEELEKKDQQIEMKLKMLVERANKVEEGKRADFLKRVGKLHDEHRDVVKKKDELKLASIEKWQSLQDDAKDAMEDLDKEITQLLNSVDS